MVWKLDDFGAEFLAQRLQACVDFLQRDRSVLDRVALAEHVVVDAVEHQDPAVESSSRRSVSGQVDSLPGLCRVRDGLGHAKVGQAIPRGNEGLRLAANDRAEVLQLMHQRIVAHHLGHARPKRLPPGAVLRALS
mgnify:CR=1 FL=1